MFKVAFVSVWLACVGRGHEVRAIHEKLPGRGRDDRVSLRRPLTVHGDSSLQQLSSTGGTEGRKPLKVLATTLLALSPTVAFSPCGRTGSLRVSSLTLVNSPPFASNNKRLVDRRISKMSMSDTLAHGGNLDKHGHHTEADRLMEEGDQTSAENKLGVILLNLGGPDSLDAVEPFLYNLFSDSDVINFPDFLQWLKVPFGYLISKTRAPQSRAKYASIGGSSPQLSITEAQGRAIEAALAERGVPAKSYIAMRYWSPFTSDALKAIKADGVKRVVVLPLYPQFSVSTTASSLRVLEQEISVDPQLQEVSSIVIPTWYNREGYINALARLVAEKCDLSPNGKTVPHVIFSAHGLPTDFVEQNADPYQRQTEATVDLTTKRLRDLGYTNNCTLSYQSRVGPVEWLRPYTDDKIRQLAAEGVREIVVVPVSFVSEHIETLEELDMEYREVAEEAGITGWQRVPALGLSQDFIDDLAEAVIEVLPSIEEPPNSYLNDGKPVALRIINDLVKRKVSFVPAP